MFFHLLYKALRRRKLRTAVAVTAVVMGAVIASTLLTVSFDINDKMGRELKQYGANILLLPSGGEGTFIPENDLKNMKTIFWRHNILGYSPYLSDTVKINNEEVLLSGTYFEEEIPTPDTGRIVGADQNNEEGADVFTTGVRKIAPWWEIDGEWPERGEALVGVNAAEKLGLVKGDIFIAEYGTDYALFEVSGILSTGGDEDHNVIVHLRDAQELFNRQDMVDRVVVSALTTPEPAKKIDPGTLSPDEYEKWYCTPYISSIMLQIEEAVPGAGARPIRQVADNEGKLLDKFEGFMFLVTAVAVISASLGVTAAINTTIFERRKEIGLMKAIGADSTQLSSLFFAEAAVTGIIGGLIGTSAGAVLAGLVGLWVFEAKIEPSLTPALVSMLISLGIALLGSMLPVKRAVEIEPSIILRGE